MLEQHFTTYICSYEKLEDKRTLHPAVTNNGQQSVSNRVKSVLDQALLHFHSSVSIFLCPCKD